VKFEPEHFYHTYNRGNNKQLIFFEAENYLYFLRKMRTHITPHAKILAWCLMPTHFHWLFYVPAYSPETDYPLNLEVGTLLSSYTKGINKKYERTGSFFQQKTKAVKIDYRNYIATCFHYIHRNPIEAGLVKKPELWRYSSYIKSIKYLHELI
jgi:putative transposase